MDQQESKILNVMKYRMATKDNQIAYSEQALKTNTKKQKKNRWTEKWKGNDNKSNDSKKKYFIAVGVRLV
jgi:hypothetical protein